MEGGRGGQLVRCDFGWDGMGRKVFGCVGYERFASDGWMEAGSCVICMYEYASVYYFWKIRKQIPRIDTVNVIKCEV